jgi:hypothetical protein
MFSRSVDQGIANGKCASGETIGKSNTSKCFGMFCVHDWVLSGHRGFANQSCGISTVCHYLLSIFRSKETSNNIFHPYSYFIIVFGLFFYALPVTLVILNPNNPFVLLMPTEHLLIVTVLVTASFISYTIGYRLPIGRQMARAVPLFGFKKRVSRPWFFCSALVLYGVGWLARIVAWRLGYHHMNPNLGEFTMVVSSVLVPLSMFSTLSYVVLLWDRFSHAKKNPLGFRVSFLAIILICLEVVAGIIQGSRSRMIFPLLFAAFVYNYSVRRLALRHLFLGTVVLVLVLAPAATLYRSAYFDALGEGGASVAGASESVERLSQSTSELQIAVAIGSVVGRLTSHLEGALVVYDKVPNEVDYAIGSTFFPSGLLNFVPRIFWADKPIIMPGREFSQIFWGRNIGELYATNTEIGLVGEAFYNFGWLGLVMPIIFGIVLRFFVVRTEDYSRIEAHWAPRLFFAVFIVNAIGVFHYYPTDVVRGGIFILVFLSILNRGLPQVLRSARLDASQQRFADRSWTPLWPSNAR